MSRKLTEKRFQNEYDATQCVPRGPYEAASADVLLLQTENPPMEWNTTSSLVTCRSNEMARSPMHSNGGRDLNQCMLNYRKWLVMSWLFQLPALVWKGSLVYLDRL